MTPQELIDALSAMSPDEALKYSREFGGGDAISPKQRAEEMIREPRHEKMHAFRLGLPTEDEKLVRASVDAARAAAASAETARSANRIALASAIASIFSAAAAIVALLIAK